MTAVPKVWISAEADYLGATGVDSVHELAELILRQQGTDLVEALGLEGELIDVSDIELALAEMNVHAITLPVTEYVKERWSPERTFPCEPDARPGRGYVKVLGVNF